VPFWCRLFLLTLLALPTAARAQDRAALDRSFHQWVEQTVWPDARKAGVSRSTFAAALGSLTPDYGLPDLALPGKKPGVPKQAEFRSPGNYLAESKLAPLISGGQQMLATWSQTLDAVERRYGVPREIVVAIWGRESAFGRVRPSSSTVRILATQAFFGSRKALFYRELIAALLVLEGDHIALSDLKSSWAGAMGQPQFLPSKFLDFAVDGDGDGKRDIWNSVPDSLSSIANFLKGHGWKSGVAWGAEIMEASAPACTLEGPDQGAPLSAWAERGARPANGRLPASLKDEAFLLMPAGTAGPAFLVSQNFYVLKSYNNSDLYALFIGQIADRLRGGSPIKGGWAPVGGFDRGDVQAMQLRLQKRGVNVGNPDGLVGFRTRVAVGNWQAANGLQPTCLPDAEQIGRIR